MHIAPRFVVVLACLAVSILGAVPGRADTSPHSLPGFAYVSPAPDSERHLPTTNIIVRPGGAVDPASLTQTAVTVSGSLSGPHSGTIRLSDDGMTILFRPDVPFAWGDAVLCTIAPGIRTTPGGELPGATFAFYVVPPAGIAVFDGVRRSLLERLGVTSDEVAAVTASPSVPSRSPGSALDSIPGLPEIEMTVTGPTAPGELFVSDIRFDNPNYPGHLLILGNDGAPVFHRQLGRNGFDLKLQPNRRLTYYDGDAQLFFMLDNYGTVIDSFQAGNGYPTDLHELILLPNGHALLMIYDHQAVDMSAVVEGGNPDAIVIGLIIQELDLEKEVVFQWRSWDHFQITDGVLSLTTALVDYSHGNSIEPDTDGHLIISSRHMNEITKLSRETGAIIWRLGGKNNQFTFANDPGFFHQHSARRLENGHLLLYDNGNFHAPPRSRAVEYALDEGNMTATPVWEYRNTPDTYGFAMGSVQRLSNGNTIIGWGSTNPTATEVTPEGVKVAEVNLPTGTFSYRAFRFVWPPEVTASARSGSIDVEENQYFTVYLSSEEFGVGEVDYESLVLAGVVSPVAYELPPASATVHRRGGPRGTLATPALGAEAAVHFPVAPLLPYLTGGNQQLALTGKLMTGESLNGIVTVNVTGERHTKARVVSPVGAFPIQLDLHASGAPRVVSFEAYDVHGRRVARWTATSDASGVVAWDGRGSNGERLRSGIYFVGTEGLPLKERTKVVLVK